MLKEHPKIVVAGAGSIGCYVGGLLAAGGAQVALLARSRIRDEIENHGLTLSDWSGREIKTRQVTCVEGSDALASADLILVCVKSRDTAAIAQLIAESGNRRACIFSLQNGINNRQVLQQYLPALTVLSVMVPYNVVHKGSGQFHCGTQGELWVQQDVRADAFVRVCRAAGIGVKTHADLPSVLWGKLLVNLNNPVNALSGLPLKAQLETGAYRRIFVDCVREGLAVLKVAGIQPAQVSALPARLIPPALSLPDGVFKCVARKMLAIDPQARSSMWEDLQKKRLTEIDFLTGEIVELGRRFGVRTPVNERVMALVKAAETRTHFTPMSAAAIRGN